MGAETKKALKKAKKKAKKEEKIDLAEDKDVDDVVDGSKEQSDNDDDDEKKESKKKSKKSSSKSSSKKRTLEEVDDGDDGEEAEGKSSSSSIDKATDRAQRKALKKKQKSELLSKIPKLDPDGIPYNKIQIRRMLRRVKHGLDQEEEREIREREKREKVEEEKLLFEEGRGGGDEEEEEEVDGNKQDQGEEDGNEAAQEYDGDEQEDGDAQDDVPKQNKPSHNPPSKKTKRSKPVPPDYICQACQNNLPNFTPHWIYDCPNKVTKKGCNTVSKKLRGLHDPPSRKVFVSGLPFECTEGHVKRYFETNMDNNNATEDTSNESTELVHCKLLKFEDSNRCKGQAFLTFGSDLGARLALKLNGCIWEDIEEPGTSSKKKKKDKKAAGTSADTKKELRLKVTKVLNRHVTKKKAGK
ncbi:hypothetical protein ACHAWC_008181 [Mediolabrus comicus]